jgi:hypothetical protein
MRQRPAGSRQRARQLAEASPRPQAARSPRPDLPRRAVGAPRAFPPTFMPLAGSVSTSSAPKARSRMRRSRDMDAGIVRTWGWEGEGGRGQGQRRGGEWWGGEGWGERQARAPAALCGVERRAPPRAAPPAPAARPLAPSAAHQLVALGGGDEGEADAGVAAGGLHQGGLWSIERCAGGVRYGGVSSPGGGPRRLPAAAPQRSPRSGRHRRPSRACGVFIIFPTWLRRRCCGETPQGCGGAPWRPPGARRAH